jgi:hypothetical protein
MSRIDHPSHVGRASGTTVPAPLSPHPGERRGSERVEPAALPPFIARLVDGADVGILNISRTGALARSEVRMLPGARIGLRFLTEDGPFVIVGRVVRSSLLSIDGDRPLYESALAFSRDFPLLAETPEAARAADVAASVPPRHGSFPIEIGRYSGEPTVLTVTSLGREGSAVLLNTFERREPQAARER